MTQKLDAVGQRPNIPKPYVVHITRRVLWSDKTNFDAISLNEWINYVNQDPQMNLKNELVIPLGRLGFDDKDFIYRSEGLSFYKPHWLRDYKFGSYFEHEKGNIDVCDPDPETIKKMIAIAGRLNAKVQGEDGEIFEYREYFKERNNPRWKFW